MAKTWYPPVRIFNFFSVFAALFASLVMWPLFMSNLFSRDSMRSFLEARFALILLLLSWKKERWANRGLPCVSLLSGKEEHLCQTFLPHLQCPKVKILLWMSKLVDVWLWPGCRHPGRGRHAASLFSPPPFQPRKQQNADLTLRLTKIFTSFIISNSLTSRSIFAASISSVATSLYGCLTN